MSNSELHKNEFDITIVGGGPAGATLARLLAAKYNVLLVDKRALNRTHDDEKCCGGLLAPDAQKVLARLGLGIPQQVLTGPQSLIHIIPKRVKFLKYFLYLWLYEHIFRTTFKSWQRM